MLDHKKPIIICALCRRLTDEQSAMARRIGCVQKRCGGCNEFIWVSPGGGRMTAGVAGVQFACENCGELSRKDVIVVPGKDEMREIDNDRTESN